MTEPLGQGTFYAITGRKNTGGAFDRIPIEDMQKNHPASSRYLYSVMLQFRVCATPLSALPSRASTYQRRPIWKLRAFMGSLTGNMPVTGREQRRKKPTSTRLTPRILCPFPLDLEVCTLFPSSFPC